MVNRDKAVTLAKKLRRLAESPNPNEARLAQERLDGLRVKHKLTVEEIEAVPEERTIRCAGDLDETWKEKLALDISRKFKCKPLRARDKIFFEGANAVEAVIQFRRIVETVIAAKLLEASDGWTFEKRDGLLFVSGRYPGDYATLFLDNEKLPSSDKSKFDNARRSYTWAFKHEPDLIPGQLFVFVTSNHECIGEVTNKGIVVAALTAMVARSSAGEPMHIESLNV